MTAHCERIRDAQHAYLSGEVSPLEREWIQAHLDRCPSCAAELYLSDDLRIAARQGPAPLDDARKRAMLDAIHRELGRGARVRPAPAPQTTTARLRSLWQQLQGSLEPRARRLVPVAAVAAALLVAVLVARPDPGVAPAVASTGWVVREAGVAAYAAAPTFAHFSTEGGEPVLRLERGVVVVEFNRPAGGAPLRVETPRATVTVLGTIFFVEVQPEAVAVGVHRGRVRVEAAAEGEQRAEQSEVGAGEKLSLEAQGGRRLDITPAEDQRARELFGSSCSYAPGPTPAAPLALEPAVTSSPAVTPAEPRPARRPEPHGMNATILSTPSPAVARETVAPGAPVDDALTRARDLWRAGDAAAALALLEAVVTRPDNPPELVGQALYLTADIERGRGHGEAAAVALSRLARGPYERRARELAALELSRLLSDLGRHGEALAALEDLPAGSTLEGEARFEHCALLIELARHDEARRCLIAHRNDFPAGPHRSEVEALLTSDRRPVDNGQP